MKSKSCKYDFIMLKSGKVCNAFLQRKTLRGFTLIEILVAVTIIATIVSMIYGSYFATAKSADAYKVKMALSSQMRKVLNQMTRQIRCSYIGKQKENKDLNGKNKISRNPVVYFNYEDVPGSGVLRLVTTHRLFCEDGYADGLFDVAYKYDKNIGTLYLSQRRFVGTSENNIEDRNWRPILENVEAVGLSFFDGQRWLPQWDFEQKKKLPFAVKISITCKDENSRQYNYSTIAYLDCSKHQNPKILFEKSVNNETKNSQKRA